MAPGPKDTCCYRSGKGVPVALTQGMEAKLVCDLSSIHGIGQILLVGKYQQHCVTQLLLHSQQSLSHKAQLALIGLGQICALPMASEGGSSSSSWVCSNHSHCKRSSFKCTSSKTSWLNRCIRQHVEANKDSYADVHKPGIFQTSSSAAAVLDFVICWTLARPCTCDIDSQAQCMGAPH